MSAARLLEQLCTGSAAACKRMVRDRRYSIDAPRLWAWKRDAVEPRQNPASSVTYHRLPSWTPAANCVSGEPLTMPPAAAPGRISNCCTPMSLELASTVRDAWLNAELRNTVAAVCRYCCAAWPCNPVAATCDSDLPKIRYDTMSSCD